MEKTLRYTLRRRYVYVFTSFHFPTVCELPGVDPVLIAAKTLLRVSVCVSSSAVFAGAPGIVYDFRCIVYDFRRARVIVYAKVCDHWTRCAV